MKRSEKGCGLDLKPRDWLWLEEGPFHQPEERVAGGNAGRTADLVMGG